MLSPVERPGEITQVPHIHHGEVIRNPLGLVPHVDPDERREERPAECDAEPDDFQKRLGLEVGL